MPVIYRFEQQQLIPRPREEVFAFFSDAANLQKLTPDFLHFQILTPLPIVMEPGTLIDYRLRLFGLPMYWRTRIESFDPPCEFIDTQLRGPYSSWRHWHRFEVTSEGTLMTDVVEYGVPWGYLGRLVHPILVRSTLKRIFNFRRQTVAAWFSQSTQSLPS